VGDLDGLRLGRANRENRPECQGGERPSLDECLHVVSFPYVFVLGTILRECLHLINDCKGYVGPRGSIRGEVRDDIAPTTSSIRFLRARVDRRDQGKA
jgi:hypothetical protein